MNCQEALSLLYDVIDKEASEIDAQQVAEHLRRCDDCAGKYHLEQSIHELLQAKLQNQDASPEIDSIKAKVLSQLDEIDRCNQARPGRSEKTAETEPGGSFRMGRLLAIAAAVIVTVTAGYFGLRAFDDHAVYIPMEQAHWDAEENTQAYASAVHTSLARSEVQEKLQFDIRPVVDEFNLVGGQLEKIDGHDVAHFVYRNENLNNVVSVFVIDAASMPLPDDLVATMVTRNGVDFYDHNCRGCRLVYHRTGNALVVTATTESSLDLLDFVPDRDPV
jgi:anti-sigma factor (TIGR02949 family)